MSDSTVREGTRVLVPATINKRGRDGLVNVTVDTDNAQQGGVWTSGENALPLDDDLAAENAALRIAVERARSVAEKLAEQGFGLTSVGAEREGHKLLATCDFALAPNRGEAFRRDLSSYAAKIVRQKDSLRQQAQQLGTLRGTIAALSQQLRDLQPLVDAADALLLAIEMGQEVDVTDDAVMALRQQVHLARRRGRQRDKTRAKG